jgi:hypothetical protein
LLVPGLSKFTVPIPSSSTSIKGWCHVAMFNVFVLFWCLFMLCVLWESYQSAGRGEKCRVEQSRAAERMAPTSRANDHYTFMPLFMCHHACLPLFLGAPKNTVQVLSHTPHTRHRYVTPSQKRSFWAHTIHRRNNVPTVTPSQKRSFWVHTIHRCNNVPTVTPSQKRGFWVHTIHRHNTSKLWHQLKNAVFE